MTGPGNTAGPLREDPMEPKDLNGRVVDQDEETPVYEAAKKAAKEQKREEDK